MEHLQVNSILQEQTSGKGFQASVSDKMWIKQRNFIFATALAYLNSRIAFQSDPMTLMMQYRLYIALDDQTRLSRVRLKIENHIEDLASPEDSGFQLRDCLTVTSYAQLNNWQSSNPHKFKSIVLPRLEGAASSEWFDEPELAASVLAIQDREGSLKLQAKDYFEKKINSWLDRNYLNGIIYYAFHLGPTEHISEYLSNINWSDHTLVTQSLALRYFQQTARFDMRVQESLANSLYSKLDSSHTIIGFVENLTIETKPQFRNGVRSTLTDYEIATTLLALNETDFDEIIGFTNPKSVEVETLLDFQKQVQQGGVFVTRRYLQVYETSFIIAWLFALVFLTQIVDLPRIGSIAGALVEAILLVILLVLGAVLIRRKRPSEIVARELFGIGNGEDEPR